METTGRYRFGLRKKLVAFTASLAVITYSTCAFFIYFVYPYAEDYLHISSAVYTFVVLFLGALWSGILAFFAAGFIIRPLQKLEATALRAAEGEIAADAELSGSNDEIHSLGIAFNKMLANVREIVVQIEANFNETNEKVVSISGQSAAAAEQAAVIASTIKEISAGAEGSAAATQKTAESVEEVTRIAEEVQEKARTANAVSAEMEKGLKDSKAAIHSLISGIEQLALDNQTSLETVKKLEDNASRVGQIIQLVGDIAAQTNLLALNASIEAARAGEHGRGFAVVAEEVRKLADESAKAVNGISGLIANIQSGVQDVVSQIERQVETANREAEKGERTNTSLIEMAETVQKNTKSVQDIAAMVDKQMESVLYASTHSEEVAAIAEETSAGAVQVAMSTEQQAAVMENVEQLAAELKDQAGQLKKTITRFKL
ncbi:methyl-accepting chemotaxis protein [Mesobacillus zeae]|uniref:Methyl-accepting chemotaxis protein n=1 Tax=Mesobacillus zeae TaxID=1917180 RepID=A0A398B3Q6_9BACI|nr:HAMP domain-containing methyl-accepting chemotaxis protein [Mesobacillus zeae]RID82393.1 methyl-accepting chemotaxis protein [Mesobacillus zeae]